MRLTPPPKVNGAFQGHNIFGYILSLVAGDIGAAVGDTIGNIVGAITQGAFFSLGGLSSFMGGMKNQVDTTSNQVVTISAQQIAANERLTDLEDITGTGVTTPIWSSAGGKDLVSFPKAMMQVHEYQDGDGSNSSAGRDRKTLIPAFKPGKGYVEFAFIRGGVDRPVIPKVVKIITGNDAGLQDISAWYLGLYVYNPANGYFSKIWDSGNRASTLTSQRQAYNIGTGLTNTFIQPDHLIAVAQLQVAPGPLQGTRSLGCIFQTNITEAAGTTPFSPHAYIGGQTTLPEAVFRSNLNYAKDKIMWAAVGEST